MLFRLQGVVQNPIGQAIPGASVAVLTQPADFSSQPGSPLQPIFAASTSNAATIIGATWSGQQITFTFSTTPPADVIVGSYIAVSGVTPSTFNSTLEAPYLVVEVNGNNVIVTSLANPGTYVSGGTVATSVLPNPTTTDGNGQWFIYAAAGIYSVQIYGPTIEEMDYPDQGVGTVAGGSVLSVGMTGDGVIFNTTVGGSPVTTTGTLVPALLTQTAKLFLAGPTSGSAATPTFRGIVAGDLPGGTGSVSSVALTLAVPAILTEAVTGSPITTSGTLGLTIGLQTQNANLVFAGPTSGGAGSPTFRGLVLADLPLTAQPLTFRTTTLLTSAEILALATTPIVLVPAPGAGFYIDIRGISIQYKFNTTAYTTSGASHFALIYAGEATNAGIMSISPSVLIGAGSSQVINTIAAATFYGVTPIDSQTTYNNNAVEVAMDVNPTLGDGTVNIVIDYAVIPLV